MWLISVVSVIILSVCNKYVQVYEIILFCVDGIGDVGDFGGQCWWQDQVDFYCVIDVMEYVVVCVQWCVGWQQLGQYGVQCIVVGQWYGVGCDVFVWVDVNLYVEYCYCCMCIEYVGVGLYGNCMVFVY